MIKHAADYERLTEDETIRRLVDTLLPPIKAEDDDFLRWFNTLPEYKIEAFMRRAQELS